MKFQIRFQESNGNPGLPILRPDIQSIQSFFSQNFLAPDFFEKWCVRRVVKRAQHSGNILQGRVFASPLAQRPGGFSLEIDDDKVVAGEQDLP